MNDPFAFQYCQKLIVMSEDKTSVLLAKRRGEADYDGVYTFIGGKMETTDGGFVAGAKREKEEEIGVSAKVAVYPLVSYNAYITKKDGSAMVLPHLMAYYRGGEIQLSDEYADYKWVALDELNQFEPKVDTIMPVVEWAKQYSSLVSDAEFIDL